MYEIGIVGDIHIDNKVSSRKDDYFQTCLDKITEVANNCKNIIILGDVFNREIIPNDYFFNLYVHINYLKNKNNNNFYSIIGNHDIFNEVEETLNKTSLGLCKLTNLIQLIEADKPITINNYTFYTSYVNLEKCKRHLKNLRLKPTDILLLHQYYEDTYEGLTYNDLKDIGCNRIFVGHEHMFFPKFKKDYSEFTIYRCGSLVRNAVNDNNLKRDIFYFILHNNEIKICKLEGVKPAKEVFTEKACTRENLQRTKFVKNINEVLQKYDNNISIQNKFSLKTILQELNIPQNCLSYIHSKYNKINEVLT